MKALSLWQPWASLVVRGVKRFETRDWHYQLPAVTRMTSRDLHEPAWIDEHWESRQTKDGRELIRPRPIRLAIHAAKHTDPDTREFIQYLCRSDVLPSAVLPRGVLVGSVLYHGAHYSYAPMRAELKPSDLELELGDWSEGRLLWEFSDPVEYDEPLPWRGQMGIFNVELPEGYR